MRSAATQIGVLLISALIFMQCGEKADEPAALIGDRVITIQKFENEFKRGKEMTELEASSDSMKLAHLNKMIDEQLTIIDAYRLKLDNDSLLDTRLDGTMKNLVANKVFEMDVTNFIVPESEVKEAYEKQKKQIHIKDIVLQFQKNDSVDTEPDIKEMINRIYEYLNDGAKFDSLARRYSQDRVSANNGGDKGFIKFSVSKNELFNKVYDKKQGEITKPFKADNEYHILKVEEVREMGQEPYETYKNEIVNQSLQKKYNEVENRKNEVFEKFIEKYSGKYNDENLAFMIQKINQVDAVEDSIRRLKNLRPDVFANFTDEDTSKVLYQYAKNKKLTIGNVLKIIGTIDPMRRPQFKTDSDVKTFVGRILIYDLFAFEGFQRGYDKDKDIVKQLTEYKESNLLRVYRKQEINDKINPTEEEIQQYYEMNKLNYLQPERRDVREIWITKEQDANKAYAEIKAGRSFVSVARKYNERAATQKKDGLLGLIRKEQFGAIGLKAFEMQKGETSGIINVGRNFSIINLVDIVPEQPKTFDEAKSQVRNELRKNLREQKEKEILDRVRNEVKVKIYEERVANTFKKATK